MKAINAWVERGKVKLSYRDDTGALKFIQNAPSEYCGFFRTLPDDLKRYARSEKDGWIKVVWPTYDSRKDWLDRNPHIESYECDLTPVKRLMADYPIEIQRPKRCYLDIETDSRVRFDRKESTTLLSWAVVDETGKSWTGLLMELDDEKRLIESLLEVLADFDQVLAWNGDGFDFPVLKAVAKRYGIWWPSRLLMLDHLALFKRMNTASESGEEKQSFALQNICMALLGEGKNEFDSSKTWEAWSNGVPCRHGTCAACSGCLVKYNLQDTDLLRKLEERTGYADLLQTICEVTHTFPDTRGMNPTAQVDAYMLRLAAKRKTHFKTKPFHPEDTGKFKGAFVMEPSVEGVERNVHVCDFASLYPSIIRSWNMSPETKGGPGAKSPLTGVEFRVDAEGMLPAALRELLTLRTEWKKRKVEAIPGTSDWKDADRKSTAYKVAANSFYGVMGTKYSRFYDREIAESVTTNGQWLIKKTIDAAAERGWKTIYGDTDSVFVKGCSVDEFRAFVKWCNVDLYPSLMAQCGCTFNGIKLSYEKAFDRLVFPVGVKGKHVAKRYVGRYLHYEGTAATEDSKPEIKGIEVKRGDSSRLGRQLQMRIIEMLMKGDDNVDHYHRIVESMRRKVLYDELPIEDIRLTKALNKELEEYKASPVHVQTARVLKERGEDVTAGTRIEYVVTGSTKKLEAIPLADYIGDSDRKYLFNRLVYPASMRLLAGAFPKEDWTRWLLPKAFNVKQLSLFDSP